MSRSIETIKAEIKTQIRTYPSLDNFKFVEDGGSQVSLFNLFIDVVSMSIFTFEVIMDQLKSDIQDIADSAVSGNNKWVQNQMFLFQYGDVITITDFIPSYPVVDESGRLQGYCGRAELFAALRELPSLEKPVSDFMRQDPPVIAADQSIVDAAVIMLREEIELLPVVSSYGGGRVIGVVSPLDVIQKAVGLLPRDSTLATA